MSFFRIYIFLAFLSTCLLLTFQPNPLWAFGDSDQDCLKCHTLTKEEAKDILKSFIPNIKIKNIQESYTRGLWEIIFVSRGKKGITYLDFPKKNLILGNIINIKSKKNITQERLTELNKVDVSIIPVDDALVMGDKNAKNRVIVFDDPD